MKLLIERRLMRDVEHERRRVSLSQVLREDKTRLARRETQSAGLVAFSHSIAIGGELKSEGVLVHIILNAYWEPLDFELPVLSDGKKNWRRWIDTALDPPHEICEWNAEQPVPGDNISCWRTVGGSAHRR